MCRPTELKLDLLSRLHTRRIYLRTVPDGSTVQEWHLNNLESYYVLLLRPMCCCTRTRIVESSGSALSYSCLAAACRKMFSATTTTLRLDVHTGRREKGEVLYFTVSTTAVLEKNDAEKDHVDVFHDTNTPCGNRPVQKYCEVALLCHKACPGAPTRRHVLLRHLPSMHPAPHERCVTLVLNKRTSNRRGLVA